jgi:hypothetical protein
MLNLFQHPSERKQMLKQVQHDTETANEGRDRQVQQDCMVSDVGITRKSLI